MEETRSLFPFSSFNAGITTGLHDTPNDGNSLFWSSKHHILFGIVVLSFNTLGEVLYLL